MMDITLSNPEASGHSPSDAVPAGTDGPGRDSRPDPGDERVELLLAMRRHLHIVHHLPGRLRLRATAGLLELAREWRGQRIALDEAVRIIDGIRSARVNPMAATAVIEYDPQRVPQAAWHRLLDGDDDQAQRVLQDHVPGLHRHLESTHPTPSQKED